MIEKRAVVLIAVNKGMSAEAFDEISKMPDVSFIIAVTGAFDLVAIVENIDVIESVQKLKAVMQTLTMVEKFED